MGECREDLKAWPATLGYPDGLDGSAQSKIPELMASEASRVWLERLLDTLGGQLQGSVQWEKAIKPVLIGAGWSDAEEAPWKLQVEQWLEKIESDEVRRRRLLARARIVDRYRTMMKQLRENERFVSEERTKLYRLGLLPPVSDVQPKGEPSDRGVASENYAALTNGATQRDLDAKWMAEYRFTALRESYARFKGDDQTPVEARCSGKPTLYSCPATGLPDCAPPPRSWATSSERSTRPSATRSGRCSAASTRRSTPSARSGSARGPTARTATRRAGSRRAPTATAPSAR